MRGNEEAQQKKRGCAGDRGKDDRREQKEKEERRKEEKKKGRKEEDYGARFSVRHWEHTPPR